MKVYPRGKDVEVVSPKENDLFSRFGKGTASWEML
jgi:hypothetical protein